MIISVTAPAAGIVLLAAILGPEEDIIPSHEDYYEIISLLMLLFSAIIAPELLIPDRRSGVINLYLVRPLTAIDYVAARWSAFLALSLILAYSGQVLLLIGFLLTAGDPVDYLRDNWLDIPKFLAAGALVALFVTTIPMAVSAFTTRRAYAAAVVIAVFVISLPVAGALTSSSCEYEYSETTTSDGTRVVTGSMGDCERATGDLAKWFSLVDVGPRSHPYERHHIRQRERGRHRGSSRTAARLHTHSLVRTPRSRPRSAPIPPLPENDDMTDASPAVISVENISKWYGSVVAVNDVSFEIQPGVTGLLGPNGAGKTTLLKMIEGLASPSDGSVSISGQSPRGNPDLYRRVGVMSEHEAVYGFYTGREFVEFSAKLHGVTSVGEAADLAIERAGMTEAQGRKLDGYSRGMRQRMRLAAAMVHQPDVLILDEPLNGTDPRQRIEFHDLMRQLASEGKTMLISSHILEEVETLADRILLMVSGKLAASGDYRAIRAKLDEQPYTVRVVSDSPSAMASALVEMDGIESVAMADDGEVVVLSKNVEVLQRSVAHVAKERGIRLLRVEPLDESLESVFSYIVEG